MKNNITAKVIADSLNPFGNRITTMVVTFPRIVLAEFNTHRMFSRNSASSRAIPFKKMLKMVKEEPFIPIAWQKDHKGMQGSEYFTDDLSIQFATSNWLIARDNAIKGAMSLHSTDNGYGSVTKQLCNRLLEPFMYHKVIVTATEWENFFDLRCPSYECRGHIFKSKKDLKHWAKDSMYDNYTELDWLQINQSQAEIHIQALAEAMWDAMNESTPKELNAGEWHLPFGEQIYYTESLIEAMSNSSLSRDDMNIAQRKIAPARCARISYETLGDNPKLDYVKDIALHNMLLESGHMSPFEHCAQAMSGEDILKYPKGPGTITEDGFVTNTNNGWCRNFKGWIQYRENVE